MNDMENHESCQGKHDPTETGKYFQKTKFLREIVHGHTRENKMTDDEQFHPKEMKFPTAGKEGQKKIGNVKESRLDIGLERHSIERVGIPERKLAIRDRHSSEATEGIILINEIFPEKGILHQDISKEDDDNTENDDYGMPILYIFNCKSCLRLNSTGFRLRHSS